MKRRASLLALGAVCLLLAAACGSTVPAPTSSPAAAGAAASSGGGGLGIPTSSSQSTNGGIGGGTVGGGSVGGGSVSGGGGSIGGSSAGGGTVTSSGGSASGPRAPGSVPGITPTTIYVGAEYLKNQGAANAAVGAGGAGGGDARDAYKAVIDQINKHGGIAGRKVVPVYASIDTTSSTPIDQQRQAACATWTQDNKVFVILAGGNAIYEECAKRAGTFELTSNVTLAASLPETFQDYPHYVEVAGMNLVRMGSVTVDGLAKQGYFGKAPKIGVVTWDTPVYREALQKGDVAALARHGLRLATEPAYLTPPQTYQDLATTSAQVNSVVLRFQSAGIDHVMLLDGAAGICGVGCIGLEFMQRAKAQQYYPRYGFNDNNAPKAGQSAGFYPNDQLANSVGVGWDDLDKSYDAGWHVNQTREDCYDLMRKNGVDLGDVNSQGAALSACDELAFLKLVASKLGSAPLSPDNMIAAVNTLGTSFPSVQTYGTSFSDAKHDGIELVRNFHFAGSCKCFKFTSGAYRPG